MLHDFLFFFVNVNKCFNASRVFPCFKQNKCFYIDLYEVIIWNTKNKKQLNTKFEFADLFVHI